MFPTVSTVRAGFKGRSQRSAYTQTTYTDAFELRHLETLLDSQLILKSAK